MKLNKYYKVPSNLWFEDQIFNEIEINDLKRKAKIVGFFKDGRFYTYEILFNWGTHNIRDKDLKLQHLIGFGDPVYEDSQH